MVVALLTPRPVSDTWTSTASPPLLVHIVGEFNLALRMHWPRAGESCKPSIVVVVEEEHRGVLYRPQLPADVRQSPSLKCFAVILLGPSLFLVSFLRRNFLTINQAIVLAVTHPGVLS
jgi:hypothetical protein